MAITNAQQYQQLVNKPADGKRPGYRGDAAYGKSSRSAQATSIGQAKGATGPGGGASLGGGRDKDETPVDDRSSALQTYNQQVAKGTQLPPQLQGPIELNKREQEFKNFLDRRNKVNLFGLGKFFKGPAQAFSDFNASKNRPFFEKVIRASKIPGLSFDATEEEFEEAYQEYMANRLAGKTDAYGNPMAGFSYDSQGNLVGSFRDDGPDPIIPMMDQEEGEETPEDPKQTLTPRILGSYFDPTFFAADGGRAKFQEGGIMPRLNQLSGNVSSAEQMLQEINQRLESAESSLGSGGGQLTQLPAGGTLANLASSTPSVQTPDPFFGENPFKDPLTGGGQPFMGNMNPSSADALTERLGGTFDGQQFDSVKSAYDYAVKSAADQREGGFMGRVVLPGEMGFEGFSNLFNRQNDPNAPPLMAALGGQGGLGGGMGSPIQQAVGMADGGIMNADIVGGMMDGNMDEMGRQMYGLGKLVKKATRGIKKLVKSPVGKAALIGAGFGFAGMGPFKGLAGSKFGLGLKDFMAFGNVDKAFNIGGKGFKLGQFLADNPYKTIAGLSFLAPLLAGKTDEEKDDFLKDYYAQQLNPAQSIRGVGTEMDFYNYNLAEGGMPSKEPVAKKTMPLLDMDGKEKDYRETGGFVDMGRMERADDVPARLSKNEFVFTADAVRNAGDGDIDKGAEVMYNMMKNLESGGDVSEESQGLEGARNMFQTSQRLGEVL